MRAEAAAGGGGGGAAGTEVGAPTRGARPALLLSPPARRGLARPRGGARRPGRAGPGAGTGLAAGAARGGGTPGGARARRRTPGAGGKGERWPGCPAEESGGAGWPAPPTSRDARPGNSLTGKLGRAANAKVLEELRVTSFRAEALFSFPAPWPPSARLGQRRMCHQFGAAGGIPATRGTGAPETKVEGGRVAELQRPRRLPRSAGPAAASEGRSPWGPLDGNQLAGLGVDVASELCCAHIISIPPTLIKPKEILSHSMLCKCGGGRQIAVCKL